MADCAADDVQCGHFDTTGGELGHHWVDLGAGEHEVAGDRRLAAAGRLEVDGSGDAQGPGRSERDRVLGDRLAARHAERIDAADRIARDADDLVEGRGVEVARRRR